MRSRKEEYGIGKGLPCREGAEGGEDCTAPQIEDSHFGLCLVHERACRAQAWRRDAKLRNEGEWPLCDADGCECMALLEAGDFAGYCFKHEPLPMGLAAAAADLRETAQKTLEYAPQGLAADLAEQVLRFVERLAREEERRGMPAGGRLLGQQPRRAAPAGAGGDGSSEP